MTHEEIKILISAYFDGEVAPSEKDIVEEHLKTCTSCQNDYKMYKAMSSSLSKWSDETLSPDEEIKVQKRFEQRREPMFTKRTAMTLGTTLALTIIIGSVVQTQLKRGIEGKFISSQLQARDAVIDENKPVEQRQKGQFESAYLANTGGAAYNGLKKQAEPIAAAAPYAMRSSFSREESGKDDFVGGIGGSPQQVQNWGTSYAQAPVNSDRKIIKNANMTLKVKNAQEAQTDLENLVTKFDGVIVNLNVNKLEDGSRQGSIVFSVYPEDLDRLLGDVRKLGEVQSEYQVGSDITNRYTYLQARIKNYQAMRDRLQKILKKNANDVDDNLSIEGQISNAERNINALENNLKNLDEQSFMAAVTVNFYDTVEITHHEPSLKDNITKIFKDNVKTTLQASYVIGMNSFSGIVILLSFLLQIALWALLFWCIYLVIRRIFRK